MRLAAALLFVASVAAAEPDSARSAASDAQSPLSFAWSAPALCPAKAEVLARAERLIGHPVARTPEAPPVGLVATVQPRSDATWQLEVLSGAHGESKRLVTAGSCDELGDAMALLIALSIDPDYAARAGAGPAPAGNASCADVPAASPAEPTAPRSAVVQAQTSAARDAARGSRDAESSLPAREPVHLAVGALGALALGRLPGVAPGGALRAALAQHRLVFALELGFFPAQRVVKEAVSADLSFATLGGSFGYALFDDLLTPYAGLEIAVLRGVGKQVEQPESHAVWLLGVDAGLRLTYPAQRAFRLLAGAQLSILAEQARFYVQPNTELFRPERLGAQFGLGAELRLR
jgi:hypothetical protein